MYVYRYGKCSSSKTKRENETSNINMAAPMRYSSTRGGSEDQSLPFVEAIMRGLALDSGLFVPDSIPQVSESELHRWRLDKREYWEVAYEVMRKYIGRDEIPDLHLKKLVMEVYGPTSKFRDAEVTPVRRMDGVPGGYGTEGRAPLYLLELFHGPTFAFKDVALQFLGKLFSYVLSKSGDRMTVLAATSGDTGSSAIHGLSGQPGVECFVMFPRGGPSDIQQQQMTTVPDKNVHCIAVEGDFDDCQRIVKSLFKRREFRDAVKLGAVNSINWARILAQIVYYFWAYFRVLDDNEGKETKRVSFTVPTGNFGDILAGYYAKRMGLPIDQLVVATNQNDILHRFFETGIYHYTGSSVCTPAPSMDISVSSNFERFLYHCSGDDALETRMMMNEFAKTKKIQVSQKTFEAARSCMKSGCASDKDLLLTISDVKASVDDGEGHGYVLDPHSACGVAVSTRENLSGKANKACAYLKKAADGHIRDGKVPVVALACAHWAKFPKVYDAALELGLPQDTVSRLEHDLSKVPKVLRDLATLEQRVVVKPSNEDVIMNYVLETLPYDAKMSTKVKRSSIGLLEVVGGIAAIVAVVGIIWSRSSK